MTEMHVDLGSAIRFGRQAKNLSQKQFAELANVSPRWLSKAETNRLPDKARPTQIRLVAKALECDPDEFIKLLRSPPAAGSSGENGYALPSAKGLRAIDGQTIRGGRIRTVICDDTANPVTRINAIPVWREHLIGICRELCDLEDMARDAAAPTTKTYARICSLAADVAIRRTREKLKNFSLEAFNLDDSQSLEGIWRELFATATKKIWTTNLSRLGAFGGRSDKEASLFVQREALRSLDKGGGISRLFIVHDDECDEEKELDGFAALLKKQWEIGIRVGLISPTQFNAVIAPYESVLDSKDFMLLDEEAIYFSIMDQNYRFIRQGKFSRRGDQLLAIAHIINALDTAQFVRWYCSDNSAPDFCSELVELRDKWNLSGDWSV